MKYLHVLYLYPSPYSVLLNYRPIPNIGKFLNFISLSNNVKNSRKHSFCFRNLFSQTCANIWKKNCHKFELYCFICYSFALICIVVGHKWFVVFDSPIISFIICQVFLQSYFFKEDRYYFSFDLFLLSKTNFYVLCKCL